MFSFEKEQKVFNFSGIPVGGQPGENPPLMIASLFHNKDSVTKTDRKGNFDRDRTKEMLKQMEQISEATGVPGMVAMVANTPEEAKLYIDFYLENTAMPFGIDMWVADQRAKATEYVAKLGIQDKFLYNSITPWDKDIKGQVLRLKDLGIRHVVIQAFDDQDQSPAGRVKSFEAIMDQGADSFDTILVDTSVMNMPSTSFSCVANRLIKEKHGFPCGGAYSNGTHMWGEIKQKWGLDGFKAMDAVVQGMGTALWSDFNFCGPAVTAPRVFPAVASAHILLSTLVYDETGIIFNNPNLPIRRHFADFITKMQDGGTRKKGK